MNFGVTGYNSNLKHVILPFLPTARLRTSIFSARLQININSCTRPWKIILRVRSWNLLVTAKRISRKPFSRPTPRVKYARFYNSFFKRPNTQLDLNNFTPFEMCHTRNYKYQSYKICTDSVINYLRVDLIDNNNNYSGFERIRGRSACARR